MQLSSAVNFYHNFHNIQICNSDLEILNVLAKFPGSCNDKFIFKNSAARTVMQQAYAGEPCWLLGPHLNEIYCECWQWAQVSNKSVFLQVTVDTGSSLGASFPYWMQSLDQLKSTSLNGIARREMLLRDAYVFSNPGSVAWWRTGCCTTIQNELRR